MLSLQSDSDLNDYGELQNYLGTRFERSLNTLVTLTQPRMLSCARDIVGLDKDENVKMHYTPATIILTYNVDIRARLQK